MTFWSWMLVILASEIGAFISEALEIWFFGEDEEDEEEKEVVWIKDDIFD